MSPEVNLCRTWDTRGAGNRQRSQYSSHEFKKFCSEWGMKHTTSLPLYPQSNGFRERMVQTVKNLLQKAGEAGEDPTLLCWTTRQHQLVASYRHLQNCWTRKTTGHNYHQVDACNDWKQIMTTCYTYKDTKKHNISNMDNSIEENWKTCHRDKRCCVQPILKDLDHCQS